MIKKRKSKKSVSGGSPAPAKPTNEEARESRDKEQSTYGGLPNRDLKKNLGCG